MLCDHRTKSAPKQANDRAIDKTVRDGIGKAGQGNDENDWNGGAPGVCAAAKPRATTMATNNTRPRCLQHHFLWAALHCVSLSA
eukprot:CAMPEP_0180494596 /NCGR_PEP_ID=MMETSP1036_2-20121128/41324_1 /TAXON_ID=632150 /ORGANISM="Azadinium spinosum, Strain 3D9" /LENGTH=83 /DNA_ID=CAMNT_0022503049 /DNA_START=1566 /DNA_END=1817 /DNA_ORIENTATION=-